MEEPTATPLFERGLVSDCSVCGVDWEELTQQCWPSGRRVQSRRRFAAVLVEPELVELRW